MKIHFITAVGLSLFLFGCTSNQGNNTPASVVDSGKQVDSSETRITLEPGKGMDLFELKTDSITQQVILGNISANRIKFTLRTLNKNAKVVCEFSDTASYNPQNGEEMYYDELTPDEPYGVKEYIYDKKGGYIQIGIDAKKAIG